MALSKLDLLRLEEALALAEDAIGLSDPNPRVGCVIGLEDGRVLGRGHTQPAGQAHAEVDALSDARRQGNSVAGATAWVTLEPCSHHGRTPPCAEALIAAGIARAVVGGLDTNPLVNGRGAALLRDAGVAVELADASFQARARELNIGFFHRQQVGRPFVRLKLASSIDGKVALLNGTSQWITGADARRDVHKWRQRASGLLTGIGTVLSDDPQMTVREIPVTRQPLRIVLDSGLRIPPTAQIFKGQGEVHIFSSTRPPSTFSSVGQASVVFHQVQARKPGVDLGEVFRVLGEMQLNEVHVECGPQLSGNLLRSGLVDELLLYLAPKVLGPGLDSFKLPERLELDGVQTFRFLDASMIGDDLRVRLRPDA